MQLSNDSPVIGLCVRSNTFLQYPISNADGSDITFQLGGIIPCFNNAKTLFELLRCIGMLLLGCCFVDAPLRCVSSETIRQEPAAGEVANDVLSQTPNTSSQTTSITPDEFIRELRAWRSKVTNLRLKWKQYSPDESRFGGYEISDSEIEGCFSIGEFIWEDTGSMMRDSTSFWKNVKSSQQTWGWSTVESMRFEATYIHSNGVGVINKILLEHMTSNQAKSIIGVEPLKGWYGVGNSTWLPDLLEVSDLPATIDSTTVNCKYWGAQYELDRDHGNMPRKIRTRPGEAGEEQLFEVTDFQKLANGMWLPKRGMDTREELGKPVVVYWEVLDARINEFLPVDTFRPPPAEKGTVIDDRTTGKTYRHAFSHWDRTREIADQAKREAPSYWSTYRSRPFSWWLIRCFVCLLTLLLVPASMRLLYRFQS